MTMLRFTSRDLENMPDDGKRYEIIDGELYVSHAPHLDHQYVSDMIVAALNYWSMPRGAGRAASGPGLIFSDDDSVIPDAVWMSAARRAEIVRDGKLYGAPELAIEILSPGSSSAQRDKDIKLKLYSRRGVLEYWIVNWRTREIEVYRRESAERGLVLIATLHEQDTLTSPLLPDFAMPLAPIFANLSA